MLNRVIDFFTSLRLTVACLAMAMVLVFAGTLAQVDLGLYVTQAKYFRSLFVYWTPAGTELKIPVWPGGYLLGWLLLTNLLAAHIQRFQFSRKKIGIFLTHAGLILLLVGQFLTELFQVESNMRIEEGQAKNYSEDNLRNELAVVDVSGGEQDRVIAFPESYLTPSGEIRHPELPFVIRVKDYFVNSWPGSSTNRKTITAENGIGARLPFSQEPPTARMDDENKPAALVEIATPSGTIGTWTVGTWLSKRAWTANLQSQLGPQTAALLNRPQSFKVGERTFELALRPVRYYKPFTLHLLDFRHDRYIGTDIPKNYASHVRLVNRQTGEDRPVHIYMNNPLRYAGETFYQGSFERGDKTTILHVVRNPAWIGPYVSCTLVGAGLTIQFLIHLFGFAKRTSDSAKTPPHAAARKERNRQSPAGREVVDVVSTAARESLPLSAKRKSA